MKWLRAGGVTDRAGSPETRIASSSGLASVVLVLEQVAPAELTASYRSRCVSVWRPSEVVVAPVVLLASVTSSQPR